MLVEKRITGLAQSIYSQIQKDLWVLVTDNDFEKVIQLLAEEGISNDDMGETLYAFAQIAANEQRSDIAIKILLFILASLEDKNELPPILSFIGDLYAKENDYANARKYYGQLPLTFENIYKTFRTFIPPKDLDGLLDLRDEIIAKTTNIVHTERLHDFVNSIFTEFADDSVLQHRAAKQYAKNLEHLQKIDPSVIKKISNRIRSTFPKDIATKSLKVLKISKKTYILNGNIWQKTQARVSDRQLRRKNFQEGTNVAIRCSSFEQLTAFRDALTTNRPEFYKFQCYLITDLKIFESFMAVEDLLPLTNCDFVIKIISERDIESHLNEAIINEECMFPHFLIFYTEDDKTFHNDILIPVIDKCRAKISEDLDTYEKQLAEIFPEDYHLNVRQKIKEKKKLKILFTTSRFTTYLQYSTRDIAAGFKKLGCEVLIQMEKKGGPVGLRRDICAKNIIEFQPDLMFCIDHLRYESPYIPKSIPYITWVQDIMPLIFELSDPTMIGPNDHIYTTPTKALRDRLIESPVFKHCNIGLLPIAFNSKLYYRLDTDYKYDVSHVSHLKMPEEYYIVYSNLPDSKLSDNQLMFRHFIHYTDGFSIQELSNMWNSFYKDKTFWEQFKKDFFMIHNNAEPKIDEETPIVFVEDLLLKIMKSRILKILLDNNINLHLFGNGWEMHPWFKKHANRPIQNGDELNQLQNASKINLNLNIGMLFHPKFSEVTGAGNFCLNLDFGKEEYPSMMTYFPDSSSVVWFNEDDLVEKLRYFLENNEEREQMASLLQDEVMTKFSSKVLAERLLREISENMV